MRISWESIFTIIDGCGSNSDDKDSDEEHGDDAAAYDDDVDEDNEFCNHVDGDDEDLLLSPPPTKVGGLDRCRVTPVKMGAPPRTHISSSPS